MFCEFDSMASSLTVYFECHLRFAASHDRESNDARHFTTSFTAWLPIPSPAHFFLTLSLFVIEKVSANANNKQQTNTLFESRGSRSPFQVLQH